MINQAQHIRNKKELLSCVPCHFSGSWKDINQ